MKYKVPTRFVFKGTFTIEAESPEQAKEFVEKHCGMTLGSGIHSSLSEEQCDWDFDVHHDTKTGKSRRIA